MSLESGGDVLQNHLAPFVEILRKLRFFFFLRKMRLNDVLRWRTFAARPETGITVWPISSHIIHNLFMTIQLTWRTKTDCDAVSRGPELT